MVPAPSARPLAATALAAAAAALSATLLSPALAGASPIPPSVPAAAARAPEREVPRADGWVTDLAGMLDEEQARQLEALMASFREGSGHDIALLTVPDLEGEPIESFALRVAREWKLGSVETNDGALLVVSLGDRALRIEVGRGLEGTLTDAICGRIIRDVITPRFQQGDLAGGLREGVLATQQAAGGDYAALPAPATGQGQQAWVALPFLLFVVVLIAILRRRGGGPRGRSGGRSSHDIWPWLVVAQSIGRSSGGGGGSFGGSFGGGFGGSGGGGFGGFGGGGGFSGGGASGRW